LKLTIPNALSIFRIATGPILVVCAILGLPRTFIVIYGLSLLSDAFDGFIARKLHETTEFGAKLDSWGDCSIILALPVSVLLLWPAIIRREAPFILTAVACYLVPTVVGVVKYRRPTSYHTWGAKCAAVVVGVALLILFAGGSPWPFRLAIPLVVLEAIEEVAMTLMLREWHADVHSVWHAVRLRRRESESHVRGDA
jgi:CDP-diacylglycerol--glycerol-3-phosphate 3-phosphatidyltransferase